MIPASGNVGGESFIAHTSDREVCIKVGKDVPDGYPGRGENLARALDGRYAPGVRCFYLTPARAAKWYCLFMAGFDARQVGTKWGGTAWVYFRAGAEYSRPHAVGRARLETILP